MDLPAEQIMKHEKELANKDASGKFARVVACPTAGGAGAAREFCELIMRAQGTLDQAQAAYL